MPAPHEHILNAPKYNSEPPHPHQRITRPGLIPPTPPRDPGPTSIEDAGRGVREWIQKRPKADPAIPPPSDRVPSRPSRIVGPTTAPTSASPRVVNVTNDVNKEHWYSGKSAEIRLTVRTPDGEEHVLTDRVDFKGRWFSDHSEADRVAEFTLEHDGREYRYEVPVHVTTDFDPGFFSDTTRYGVKTGTPRLIE